MSDSSDAVSRELPVSAQYQVLWHKKKEKKERRRSVDIYAYIYSTEKLYSTISSSGETCFHAWLFAVADPVLRLIHSQPREWFTFVIMFLMQGSHDQVKYKETPSPRCLVLYMVWRRSWYWCSQLVWLLDPPPNPQLPPANPRPSPPPPPPASSSKKKA